MQLQDLKGAYRQEGSQLLERGENSRTGEWLEGEGGQMEVGCQGEVLYRESGEVLEQLPREAVDASSIPGGVQGQVGWGPEQPGLL